MVASMFLGAIHDVTFHGLGLSYPRNSLPSVVLSMQFGPAGWTIDMLQVPSTKVCQLAGTRRQAFSFIVPAFWNILLSEIRMTLTLLVFCKAVKTRLGAVAWEPEFVKDHGFWLYGSSFLQQPDLFILYCFNRFTR